MDLCAARKELPPLRLLAPQPRESMPPRPVPNMRRIRVRKTSQETRQDLLPRNRHCRVSKELKNDLLIATSSHLEQGGVMTLLLTVPDMLHHTGEGRTARPCARERTPLRGESHDATHIRHTAAVLCPPEV